MDFFSDKKWNYFACHIMSLFGPVIYFLLTLDVIPLQFEVSKRRNKLVIKVDFKTIDSPILKGRNNYVIGAQIETETGKTQNVV